VSEGPGCKKSGLRRLVSPRGVIDLWLGRWPHLDRQPGLVIRSQGIVVSGSVREAEKSPNELIGTPKVSTSMHERLVKRYRASSARA